MQIGYIAAVEKFGEDSKVASEEFFGIFNTFLSQFAEARSENVAARRKKEEEEKKLRQQEEAKQRDQDRKAKRKARHAAKAAGEFDDLVSALRSGDLYEEEKTRRTGAPPVARKVTGTGRSRFDSNKRER